MNLQTQHLEQVIRSINTSNYREEDLKPFLDAYSKYSEVLKNTRITLKYNTMTKDFLRTMYPVSFLFYPKSKIPFTIYTSINSDASKGAIFKKFGFREKKGWYGHELAHTLNFSQKSKFKLTIGGITYVSSYIASYIPLIKKPAIRYLRRIERETDNTTINQGLGLELSLGSYYLFYESSAPEKMLKRYRQIYTPTHDLIDKTLDTYFTKLNKPRIKKLS